MNADKHAALLQCGIGYQCNVIQHNICWFWHFNDMLNAVILSLFWVMLWWVSLW